MKEEYIQEFIELDNYLKYNTLKRDEIKERIELDGIEKYGTKKSFMLYQWNTYISLEVWNNKFVERTFAFAFYKPRKKTADVTFHFYEILRKIVGNNYTAVNDMITNTRGGPRINHYDVLGWRGIPDKWYINQSWNRDYKHLAKPDDYETLQPYYDEFNIRYSQYESPLNNSGLPRMKYLSLYLEWPKIELLVKNGYSHLVSEIRRMNKNGKTIESILKVDKNLANQLKANTYLSLYTVQSQVRAMKKYKFPTVNHYQKFKDYKAGYFTGKEERDIYEQNACLITDYLITNKKTININDYIDYLINATKLNINLSEKKHLCPPIYDFNRLHDEYAERVEVLKNAAFNDGIKATAKKIQKLIKEFPDADYAVLVPTDAKEIKDEGKVLKHCVGTYADRVSQGTIAIAFIRKKEHLDEPFVTVEIDPAKKKILQVRGYKNNREKPLDDSVIDFVKLWCNKAKIKNSVFA